MQISRGYNPFQWIKLPFLIKRLEVAEATEREAREKHLYELKRLEVAEATEREARERHIYELKVESKNIMLSREESDKYKPSPVNREKLNNWQQRGMFVRQVYGGEIVEDFEDLSENELYYLAKSEEKSSFGGYSRVEGDVQTKDCVDSIMKGVVRIEDFNESTTKVIFEYNLTPPKEVIAKVPKMSFPIRPDALLIQGCGDVWLFVESKHKATKQDVYIFERKMRLVIQYMDQNWVFQNQTPPKRIVYALCSVGQFDEDAVAAAGESMILIVREGAEYRLL